MVPEPRQPINVVSSRWFELLNRCFNEDEARKHNQSKDETFVVGALYQLLRATQDGTTGAVMETAEAMRHLARLSSLTVEKMDPSALKPFANRLVVLDEVSEHHLIIFKAVRNVLRRGGLKVVTMGTNHQMANLLSSIGDSRTDRHLWTTVFRSLAPFLPDADQQYVLDHMKATGHKNAALMIEQAKNPWMAQKAVKIVEEEMLARGGTLEGIETLHLLEIVRNQGAEYFFKEKIRGNIEAQFAVFVDGSDASKWKFPSYFVQSHFGTLKLPGDDDNVDVGVQLYLVSQRLLVNGNKNHVVEESYLQSKFFFNDALFLLMCSGAPSCPPLLRDDEKTRLTVVGAWNEVQSNFFRDYIGNPQQRTSSKDELEAIVYAAVLMSSRAKPLTQPANIDEFLQHFWTHLNVLSEFELPQWAEGANPLAIFPQLSGTVFRYAGTHHSELLDMDVALRVQNKDQTDILLEGRRGQDV